MTGQNTIGDVLSLRKTAGDGTISFNGMPEYIYSPLK
jgi:hypothetical protein